MKCPKCARPVDHEAESCYSCGYSEMEASLRYGANSVALNRVHDAAHCLRKQERDDLNAVLDQMESKFPQMLFCAYLGALPRHLNICELGFWLLNHGQVRGAQFARPNENAILVIMDMNTRQIGLSLGYFAELLITEEEGYRALVQARPALLNAEYGEAVGRIFARLGRGLAQKGRRMRRLTSEQLRAHSRTGGLQVLDIPSDLSSRPEERIEFERLKSA